MAEGKDKAKAVRFGPRAQKLFLDCLAASANVRGAARAAGLSTTVLPYRLRHADSNFAARWGAALVEGYVRLEEKLLAHALAPANARGSEALRKEKAQQLRVGMALLAAHRATVRGERPAAVQIRARPGTARSRVEAKLADMRERMKADDGQ